MSFFSNLHRSGSKTVNQYGAVDQKSYTKMPMPFTSGTPSSTSTPPPTYSRDEAEDPRLTKLREYDTVFLVDDSTSMLFETSGECTPIRWTSAGQALAEIAEIAARYDEDGIDIHFINSSRCMVGVKDASTVLNLFSSIKPDGGTDIGQKLKELLPKDYMEQAKLASQEKAAWPKRINYLIITDGGATDPRELKAFLKDLAKKLYKYDAPPNQIGFQFIQIGDSREASKFLSKLDGDYKQKSRQRDIVDTVMASQGYNFDSRVLLKALIGGINRGMDGRKR